MNALIIGVTRSLWKITIRSLIACVLALRFSALFSFITLSRLVLGSSFSICCITERDVERDSSLALAENFDTFEIGGSSVFVWTEPKWLVNL